jgi:demethylmenaquinone methyltransferase/2-methoxy-6-polyprenyl-1,4-benzoquinol methylase
LDRAFDTPEIKRQYNRRLFATIAPRYDLITRLLSYGQDQPWKRRLVERAAIAPGERALDLACGTGDIAFALAGRGARVVGLDMAMPMLERAKSKPDAGRVAWVAGDMSALPVATASVDLVTAGYGLRNAPVLADGLAEIARVLKPGGRFLSLDFNRPEGALLRSAYLAYLGAVGACLGRVLHGDGDTYRYIAASLRRYPGAPAVAAAMARAGFADATWTPLLGGLMALHVGTRGA